MMRRFNQLASRGRRQPAPRALVGLLLLLWLTACQAVVPPTPVSGGVQPAPQPLRLVLLHTNDTWGYLWPCGWMPAVGGVARRATKITEARKHNEFVLLLDAGDSLTGDQAPATTTQGRTSVEIMNLLGYDALALGPQDLALGLGVLRKRMSEARFAVLSANAADAATGAAIAQPYVIRTIAGHRIAIIGLSDAAETQDIIVSDPVAAAQAAVAAVADRADIIILLSHAGLAEDQTIAETVPGIDVIVSGGPGVRPEPARHPTTGTLIVHADEAQPGHAGRVLGRQTLTFDAAGQLQQVQIEYIQLGPEIADDAEVAAWVEEAITK